MNVTLRLAISLNYNLQPKKSIDDCYQLDFYSGVSACGLRIK